MFVIEVTWKAEWVGGLTFETHPAHRDAVPHAAPTQTQARLNSLKSRSLGTGHFLCLAFEKTFNHPSDESKEIHI